MVAILHGHAGANVIIDNQAGRLGVRAHLDACVGNQMAQGLRLIRRSVVVNLAVSQDGANAGLILAGQRVAVLEVVHLRNRAIFHIHVEAAGNQAVLRADAVFHHRIQRIGVDLIHQFGMTCDHRAAKGHGIDGSAGRIVDNRTGRRGNKAAGEVQVAAREAVTLHDKHLQAALLGAEPAVGIRRQRSNQAGRAAADNQNIHVDVLAACSTPLA